MQIILPIGGIGKRFKDEGYSQPKPFVKILGKQVIFWVIENLKIDINDYILIIYNKELAQYNFENVIFNRFPKLNIEFLCLPYESKGAVETLSYGFQNSKKIVKSEPFVSLDCDTFYTEDIVSKYKTIKGNAIFYFKDYNINPIFSYIELKDDKVVAIKEKEKISDNANTGAYCFESVEKFLYYSEKILSSKVLTKNEFYISSVYDLMTKNNETITGIEVKNFHCLGTPLQLKMFGGYEHNIEKKRICFDLDNTLVTYPIIPGDYTSVKPILKNIEQVRFLKKLGHEIIIYTARRMKTHQGNVNKVIADIGQITFNTLRDFDIPYDEVCFGKPFAHLYVDDLAINPYVNDIEKEFGYYQTEILPRNFNTIEKTPNTIIKQSVSDKINGEIFWYKNIPEKIKKFFPQIISIKDNYIEIEKINGLTFSYMLIENSLKENHLEQLLNTIDEIHNCEFNDININIYDNYINKTIQRYIDYDYSPFQDSDRIFKIIISKCREYEQKGLGKKLIIHGDPVFTNIFLDNKHNIKMIDMNGKQRNVLTILGDSFYDYAKIYQSLTGYDFILAGKKIVENDLKKYFEKYFIEKFGEEQFYYLKYLTASLYFSLIPLHDNEKCQDYYKCIFGVME